MRDFELPVFKTGYTHDEFIERLNHNIDFIENKIQSEIRLMYKLAMTDLELKTVLFIAKAYGEPEVAAEIEQLLARS